MYRYRWLNYYFKSKPTLDLDKWTLLRRVGQDQLSPSAQLRLEWLISYQTVFSGNAAMTAAHFGISRKTFHKWLSRFEERSLKSLEEQSRAPKKKRAWLVSLEEENRIISLRKQNMEYGKKKLRTIYQREYGQVISTWKVERVIRKHNLYPDKVKHRYQVGKRAKAKPKIRIHEVKAALGEVREFGFLWHIDAITVWWSGQRRVIFTALEELTKIAFARIYTTNSSGFAEDFLKRLMYLVEGKVAIMHQDNGAEFQGNFEKVCKTLGILQIYSRPHTPKDNPALERFNSSVQHEWLDFSEVGLDDIPEANLDLTTWLIKYNSYRPHEALANQTPLAYAQENFFKVLPMWPACTITCPRFFTVLDSRYG
jgi:transposase InsO family protein